MLALHRLNTDISFKNLDSELQSINEDDTEQTVMQQILSKHKKKSANSNHAKDEIDKHFQDFLKFRKHDDYIEYKLSYMEAKAYFKNMNNEKPLTNVTDNKKLLLIRGQNNSKFGNNAFNPLSFKLPSKSVENPFVKKNSLIILNTRQNNLELGSLDKNYYNWKSLKTQLVDSYKRVSLTDAKKAIELPGGSVRECTEVSFSKIKLIDKTKKKSSVASLRRSSRIPAIKNNGLLVSVPETNSFQNFSFTDFNLPEQTEGFNTGIEKDTMSIQTKTDPFLPKIVENKVSFNNENNVFVLKVEDIFDMNTADNNDNVFEENEDKSSKSSFCLASNIPVFEQDEFKNSIDDARIVNEDEIFKDDRKSTAKSLLSSRYERTKEWIESHEYFFSNITE
jgi:hypothetical protein